MEAESAFRIPFQYKQGYQSGGYNDYLSLCGYSFCFGVGWLWRQSYDIFAKWQREKENKYKMVIIALKEAAQTTIMIFFLRICFKIIKR